MPKTLIIGAGLAGLTCAYHRKAESLVLERSDGVGGMARTFARQGFLFDCTGHWLHLSDPSMRQFVASLLPDLLTVQRRAAVFSHQTLTPYPFQAHTHGLPTQVVADCVLGYFRARETAHQDPERSFEDFIRRRMGDGIAQHFMLPYNTKLWTVAPSEMAYTWCQRFVPLPTPEEIVYGALQPQGTGEALGYNATFLYPRQGGIGALAQALARDLPVRFNAAVHKVDWRAKEVQLITGERLGYQTLVSTMPLKALAQSLVAAPEAVQHAAAQLRSASVTYWNVGLARANGPQDAHWIYFPEAQVPFYRAGSSSAAVPGVAPAGHRSYYVEVSHPTGSACPASDADILRGLRSVGLLRPDEEPVLMEAQTLDCAYVIMDQQFGAARALLLEWLQAQRILSIGRYGAWTYDSMEGAMLQGKNVTQNL